LEVSEADLLKAEIRAQRRRLDYAVLQMEREAKFKMGGRPEDARFLRAFGVVTEVRDKLRDIEY
jgi:hypothetical protein